MEKIRATALAESTHVLSIGISNYADPNIKDLPAAEGEALNLAAAFWDPMGCAIPEEQVATLASAASSAIADAVKAASSACSEESILIIYFSGHAFRDATGIYLCGANARLEDLQRTSLSGVDLANALSSCPARGILLVLDCCLSAGFAENAPEFFFHTQSKDFRVLLAASRENELSWEVGNGQGTLFSKYLIEIVKGTIAVGLHPGEISLTDLVESIDFHLNEDLKVLHPDVPQQQPIIAGAFNRDPVLLFHRKNGLANLTVEKDRVSRSLHRRRMRRLLVSSVSIVIIGFLTYLTWLDKHLFASADENLVRIYRGYPNLGGPGYPKLIWEQPLSTTAFLTKSPLKTGGTVVAPLDRPIQPTLDAQLNEIATISILHTNHQDSEARARLLPLLGRIDESAETSHFAHLLIGEVATSEDLPLLRKLLTNARPEIRTSAVKALLRLSPKEGFKELTSALGDFDQFDQRALINEFRTPCPEGAPDYFNAAATAGGFNGVYPELTDAAARIGCSMTTDALGKMAPFWPEFELNDLAKYAKLFRGTEIVDVARLDPVHSAFLTADDECPIELIKHGVGQPSNSVVAMSSILLLLSPGCTRAVQPHVALTDLKELVIETNKGAVSFTIPSSVGPALGTALVPLLSARADPVSIAFISAIVDHNSNNSMKASAVKALLGLGQGIPLKTSSQFINSEDLELRRLAYESLARVDHMAAFSSLRTRINDQGLIDWPDLVYSVSPSLADLNSLRPYLGGGALEKERAVAVLAMFGSEDDIHQLATDPLYQDRRAIAQYVAANPRLMLFRIPDTSQPYDEYQQIVKTAQEKRKSLEGELGRVPDELRGWRIRQILEWRGNAFDTSFRQVLNPGLKLWLTDAHSQR
jgi:hypothetical protein